MKTLRAVTGLPEENICFGSHLMVIF